MKQFTMLLILIALLLGACSGDAQSAQEVSPIIVTDGDAEAAYTITDLKALPVNEVTFGETTYTGVTLKVLLENAGFTLDDLKAVKAVASDGYSANYDPYTFLRDDVIVAYATVDGSLSADDGQFRMVLPGEAGKVNVRMLVTLQVIP